MLVDVIKRRSMEAMKAGRTLEKEILRVALGEIQVAEARGTASTDDEAMAIVRKLVKSNEETLAASSSDEQKKTLTEEIAILKTLLPASLGVPQIVEALAPVRDAIRAAANDGQATGVAMKHLKSTGAVVNGKDVSEAVKQVRS
jgi:uncharacterized protein YqeY